MPSQPERRVRPRVERLSEAPEVCPGCGATAIVSEGEWLRVHVAGVTVRRLTKWRCSACHTSFSAPTVPDHRT